MTEEQLHEKFKNISDKFTAYTTVNTICKTNNMVALRYLTKSEEYKQFVHPHLGTAFINSCIFNNLEMIKYLLTERGLTVNVPIKFHDYDGLIRAVRNANTSIVKYLLTSPDLKEHADINAQNGEPLYIALKTNNSELIDYFLYSSELKEHANINDTLKKAVEADDFYTIEKVYLLLPDLSVEQTEQLFLVAYQNKSMETLHYLIFDKNIEISQTIENRINGDPIEQVKNWFELRDVNKDLNENLNTNDAHIKKNKI